MSAKTILRRSARFDARAAANAVTGVSATWKRELDIVGIGYRVEMKGRVAIFTLGYSHSIEFLLQGVDMTVDKQTHIVLSSHDRQLLGQTAANMRALRPPDPYKNKGVRYTNEVLRKKVGKTGSEVSNRCRKQIRMKSGCAYTNGFAVALQARPSVPVWPYTVRSRASMLRSSTTLGRTIVAASSNDKLVDYRR